MTPKSFVRTIDIELPTDIEKMGEDQFTVKGYMKEMKKRDSGGVVLTQIQWDRIERIYKHLSTTSYTDFKLLRDIIDDQLQYIKINRAGRRGRC